MIRRYINIVENAQGDTGAIDRKWWGQPWPEATPMQLRGYAEGEGMTRSGPMTAADADWVLVPEFPLSEIMPLVGDQQAWAKWLENEHEDGYEGIDGSVEPDDPIIVAYDPADNGGKAMIWDGWHRSAGAIISGRTTIPAVVGVPRK